MRWLLVLLSVVALFLHGSNAKQFEHWYRFYRQTLTQEEEAPQCHANYADAVQQWGANDSKTCKDMASCLFRNTAEIDKADMSSALVLLGLTPTVLGQIGPTIKAKAQLGFQSPVLGLLCLLGAPSIAFEKLWVDPSVAIKEPSAKSPYELDSMSSQARWKIWAIHLLKYLFSAGAMVNVFHAAFTLGQQTITSWKCTYWYLELIWVSTTIAPILFGVAAVWNESRSPESYSEGRAMWSRIFYSLSNILAAVQVFFGTVLLSSALFIGTLDALGVVGRLMVSALVCQFITALELERMEN